MQLTAGFLLVLSLSVSAAVKSQKITLSVKNAPFEKIFAEIKRQTNFVIIASKDVLDRKRRVSVEVQQMELRQFLETVFANKPFVFEIKGETIFVKEKAFELSEKLSPHLNLSPPPITIQGRIINEKGEPVVASITIKGTKNGTTSNADGTFELSVVDENAVLIISGINIETQEIKVEGRNKIIIITSTKIDAEEEVTIKTNYYSTTKKLATGSISKVTAKDIEKQPVTSPLMALQGRVPGLEITPASGAPGVAPTIRIRGTNSLRNGSPGALSGNGNYPLYVIDGVPVVSEPARSWTTSFTSAGYDPLSTINPANIESIEVLKDADATAIYGSRGANGVILITTKRNSRASEKTTIELIPYIGVGHISKKMDLMDTKEYISMRREGIKNDGLEPGPYDYDIIYWDTTRNTDWQKLLIGGTSNISDIQATVSSGTKSTLFRFNAGYHKETLVLPGDFNYTRISGQLTVNHQSLDQKFKMMLSSIIGSDNNRLFADGGAMMNQAISLAPNGPEPFLQDGSLNWEVHKVGGIYGGAPISTWSNPFRYLLSKQNVETFNTINSGTFTYEFWPGVNFSTSAGYSYFQNGENVQNPIKALSPNEQNRTATSNFVNTKRVSWIAEPKISYNKTLRDHSINIIAGATFQRTKEISDIVAGKDYVSDAMLGSMLGAGRVDIVQNNSTEYKYNSLYARVAYNWQEKYLLSLSGRRDGSSRFGPNNKFGNFGSAAVGWIFTSENFTQKVLPFISFGKLRASYGITGNDQIGDYSYLNLYQILSTRYGTTVGVTPDALYNPDFAWEVTRKFEAAMEISFMNNRFGVDLNWYRNRSSNQLVAAPLPLMTGFLAVLSNLDATVENSGWEFTARGDVLNSRLWSWNISLNLSIPKNRLIKFDDIEESSYKDQYRVGEPLSLQWLYTWKGVNSETGIYQIEDKNKDGLINDLDRVLFNLLGNPYYGGLNHTIRYKNLYASLHFSFSHQNKERYMPSLPGQTNSNQQRNALDKRWRNAGDVTEVQRFSRNEAFQAFAQTQFSDYNSTDASFIRLKTVSVNYQLPDKWLSAIKMQEAKIFVQGQNIFTLTRYQGPDPETGIGLPPLRIITTGIQVKF